MKTKRKITKIDDENYVVLKPIGYEDGWEKHGKIYSRKGLTSLLERDVGIEFIVSDEIKRDVEDYIRLCDYKKIKYSFFKSN